MRIITSCGFPYKNKDNFVHAEEQDGDLFVSKELLDAVKKYLIESYRFTTVHHDHHSIYSSGDPEHKKEVIK